MGAGPGGWARPAAAKGEERGTKGDGYEPYLMQITFVARTPRGRVVLPDAYAHFGRKVPQNAIRQMSLLDALENRDEA